MSVDQRIVRAIATLLVIFAGYAGPQTAWSEEVDRIVAVVSRTLLGAPNGAGQIITWSEAYEEARYQAFQSGSEPPRWMPTTSDTPERLREIVDKMIDQILLEQALSRSPLTPSVSEDALESIQEIADRYPDAETFQNELHRYGLSEGSLARRLRREKQLMDFVDFTLRPDVRVASNQVEQYYESVLLPQLEAKRRGTSPAYMPPLEEVREQIEEILTQQDIDRRLEQWLAQLRRSAKISLRL